LYVLENVVQFVGIDRNTKLRWAVFATGEEVLIQLLTNLYSEIELFATEHSLQVLSLFKARETTV
jgi:hypothetical protein